MDQGKFVEEMLFMEDAGMSRADIINSATRNAADLLGISDITGTIEDGKDADLVILDPAKDTIFDKKQMKMKMKKSVYENFHFHGGIEHTYLRGMEVKTGIPGGRYIHR